MMTDDELKQELENLNGAISGFGPENKLSNPEWRRLQRLKREQSLLNSIKKAREEGNSRQEVKQMAEYTLLKEEKERHPILSYLMKIKLRSGIWW